MGGCIARGHFTRNDLGVAFTYVQSQERGDNLYLDTGPLSGKSRKLAYMWVNKPMG